MDRSNHYEAAFQAYLQWHGLCHVAVDETRRAVLGDEPVKNLDFIVLAESGARLLVDVKGRRFPGVARGRERHVWESWSTLEDISGLLRWLNVFGAGYRGLLVFMYHIQSTVDLSEGTVDLWTWRGSRYLVRAVAVDDYRRHMRRRSPRWGTVGLPGAAFRDLVRPFFWFIDQGSKGEEPWRETGSLPESAGRAAAARAGTGAAAGFAGR